MAESTDTGGVASDVDPGRQALIGVLVHHDVSFVVIGGAAIQSHGRRYDTLDVDVAPDTDAANLEHLAAALNELECRLITDPADASTWVALPRDYFTPRTLLAATIWNLATRHGQLDVTFAPSGFPGGYEDLAPRAVRQRVAGTTVSVPIAALADVHASKRAADRPKDREYLERFDGSTGE